MKSRNDVNLRPGVSFVTKRLALCLILAALLGFAACAPAGEDPPDQTAPAATDATSREADVEAIQTFFRGVEDSINAGDFEEWFARFTDDALFLQPNAATVEKESQRATAEEFWASHHMQETFTIDEIEVAGNLAYARATYEFQATPKAGGESMVEQGKILWILARQGDGSWLSSRAIWNRNSPGE
jgi:ketosteroid isomerase-like protein